MIIYTLIMHYYNFRGPQRISALKRTSTSQKILLKQEKKMKIIKVKVIKRQARHKTNVKIKDKNLQKF